MKKLLISVIVLLALGASAALANVFITPSPSGIVCPVCTKNNIIRYSNGESDLYLCLNCGKIETINIEDEMVQSDTLAIKATSNFE